MSDSNLRPNRFDLEYNALEDDPLVFAGDAVYGSKLLISGSLDFLSSMTMSDLFNAWVTSDANKNGVILPGMPLTKEGRTEIQNGDFIASAAAAGNALGVLTVVSLSIFFIGNLYVIVHKRLAAHHVAVVALHKCYRLLSRIEMFLKTTQLYCERYYFQIDSIEIEEDIMSIFKLIDTITNRADVRDVYNNITQGRTFKLETVNQAVVPIPVAADNPGMRERIENHIKNFGSKISMVGSKISMVGSKIKKAWNETTWEGFKKGTRETFEGIHRVTTNIAEWSIRFDSIMTELNSHFTLLISEFFMLLNLHQLQHNDKYNKDFAKFILTEMKSNNPVLCIKLQIMLAPLLRARIVLVSCALSTNTPLCRETINAEMQELDKATGLGSTINAYLKKISRLYKTGAKTINVNLFIGMLRRAVNLVEASVYYKDIIRISDFADLEPVIHDIKRSLVESVDQGKINDILKNLEHINRIIMRCGDPNLLPFQMDQRSEIDTTVPDESDISRVYERQVFFYDRDLSSGSDSSNMRTYSNLLNELCEKLKQMKRPVDNLSYDVVSHFREPRAVTDRRVHEMYHGNDRMITEVGYTQSQYNELYKYVMDIDPSASKGRSISEFRGRGIAACIMLLVCIDVQAITVDGVIVDAICKKCESLIQSVKDPKRTATYAAMIFTTTAVSQSDKHISSVIERILNSQVGIRQSNRQQVRGGPAAAMSAIREEDPSSDEEIDSDNGAGVGQSQRLLGKSLKSNSSKPNSAKGGKTRKPMMRTRRKHKKRIQVTRNKKQTRILKVKNKRRYTRRHS